ncbi:MAG: DUF1553 domain-containing protein [Planctomycetes bacterium]|nr:DUF1553 domain-containing protein [Planctomycetota bacterium]
MRKKVESVFVAILAASIGVGLAGLSTAQERLEYNRDIRPILADNCFACHGPDSASRKADLRIDQRDAAIEAGAIVPGQIDRGGLIERIQSSDAETVMPPPDSGKKLTPEQKERLARWIREGAEYQLHWSLISPRRPDPPPLAPGLRPGIEARNPIDHFILASLAPIGLRPAPQADRRTLARRLSLDLVGLPPSPAEVEAFVNDNSENAYEKFVDRLLDSPHWGEHRARYWLDVARYADTHGIHFDNYREIWAYRDWVIGAFNRNLPFDQFTIEQLAGDLLPQRTLEQQIASGFNRCNITTNEGGTIPEEYLVLYTRDRTETVAQVWLGSTFNCAVCHDHKFDPWTMKDFYSLSAFFNNTTQGAMDGNIRDTPPTVVVPSAADRGRWEALVAEIPAARVRVDARREEARPAFDAWLASATADMFREKLPSEGLAMHAPLNEGEGNTLKVKVGGELRDVPLQSSASWQDGVGGRKAIQVQGAACELPDVGDFERGEPFTCAAWVRLPANDSSGAICARMDRAQAYRGWDFWAQRRQVGTHIVSAWPQDAVKVVTRSQLPANQWVHVAFSYDGSGKAAGVRIYVDGKPQETLVEADKLAGAIHTDVPFKVGQRSDGEPLSAAGIQDLRIYRRTLEAGEINALASATRLVELLAKQAEQRTDKDRDEILRWWLENHDTEFRSLGAAVAALEQEQQTIRGRSTIAHVMQERTETPGAFMLHRGEYDKRRDPVTPRTPLVLPSMSDDLPLDRLGFARWLLRPEHPLTARVTVNRIWQELFGVGLVRTSGDFGVAGELPSHPELLDWMAVEFRESGWDIKRFYKLLVSSATYRQSAATTAEKLERDPANRMCSRGPRFRLDAEVLRDYALAASGLLVPKLGGPSVKPYQPDGVWEAVAMIGSNTRDYRPDTGENLYRRSMYTFWKRSAPPASLDIFNAPNRETCAVRRERTNTPLQALVTLNDPQFVEAARLLAQRTMQKGGSTVESRVDFMARQILCRPLRDAELAVVFDSFRELSEYYAANQEDARRLIAVGESRADESLPPGELAAWTMLANELLNLDEVVNK